VNRDRIALSRLDLTWYSFPTDFITIFCEVLKEWCITLQISVTISAIPYLCIISLSLFRRKLDARFLDKRRHELERFLAVLLCHPVVRKSPDLRAFLNFTPTPVTGTRSEASTIAASTTSSANNKASTTSSRTGGATSPGRRSGGGGGSSSGDSPSSSTSTTSSVSLRSLVDPFLAPFTQGDEARSGGDSTSTSSVGKGAPPGATNGSSSQGSLSSLNGSSNGGSTDNGHGGEGCPGSSSGGGGKGADSGRDRGQDGGSGGGGVARSPAEEGARIDAQVDAACEEAAWEPIRGMWRDVAEDNEFQVRGCTSGGQRCEGEERPKKEKWS